MNDLFQAAFIRHATFDTFRYQFVSSVIGLEVTVGGTFGHRAQGAHTAVGFIRTPLVEFDFTRRFFGTGQHGAHHHGCGTCGDRFGDVTREADTAVRDNRNTGAFQRFNRVRNRRDLRHAYASDDTGGTDRARADTHFHRAATRFRQRASACACCHVTADNLEIRVFSTGFTNTLQNAFGVAVGGVNQQHVNARGNQRVNALFVTCARANRSADAQTAMLVFTGVRFTFCFLEIFNGDHAAQVEVRVHNQRFLNAFFVHFRQHHVAGFAFTHGHQTLFWRHVDAYRLVQVSHETHVTTGNDADQFVVFSDYRVACKAVTLGQGFHFVQRGGWQNGLRIGHDTGFMLLHAANFFRLTLDRHVFVDKANAAFLCQGDSQTRFSHGVHCCGEHRNVQTNGFRQLRAEVGSIRQNGGVSGNEEDVVKRQCFFSV